MIHANYPSILAPEQHVFFMKFSGMARTKQGGAVLERRGHHELSDKEPPSPIIRCRLPSLPRIESVAHTWSAPPAPDPGT